MASYLITGVAGFIGSTIAHTLIQQGHDVRGVDDLSSGVRENVPEGVQFMQFDIRDPLAMREACEGACYGVDYVLHLAAVASVPLSIHDPIKTHDINVNGTLNLLCAARNRQVKRFIYSASSSAYGDSSMKASVESDLPNPMSPYAVQKLTGEYYVQSFFRNYGMETMSLRYFNIFGSRQSASSPYSGVIAHFIHKMLAGETPTIYGTGQVIRDFTFVDNVVQANLLACNPMHRAEGQVYNIGTGNPTSVRAIYNMLSDILDFKKRPTFAESRIGDIPYSLANIDRARSELHYVPDTDLFAGLKKTIDWYRA